MKDSINTKIQMLQVNAFQVDVTGFFSLSFPSFILSNFKKINL